MKIKYTAPCLDYSGYGEAGRHDVASLVSASINVTIEMPSYTLETADFGKLGELCRNLHNKDIAYKIKIIHTTPDTYPNYIEEGKYNIGRVFWETDRLPVEFASQVQKVDEIWTGSEYNADAIRKAGVTKPIHIIPEAIETDVLPSKINPYHTLADNTFKFYSIFEWTERKNPEALLNAFWLEFQNDERVSLTIKTYRDNFMKKKSAEIDTKVRLIKKKLQLNKYAPVYLYRRLMDRRDIYRFHKSFDCFVSAHRGEGWGIPQMEAMLMENPIISTNVGGIHEYIPKEAGILLPYKHIPVQADRNMKWYASNQNWADVDVKALRKAMRTMYENRKEIKKMGKAGRKTVLQNFSTKAVGHKMALRLREITKQFEP